MVAPDDNEEYNNITPLQTALDETIWPLADNKMEPHMITPVTSYNDDDDQDLTPLHKLEPHKRLDNVNRGPLLDLPTKEVDESSHEYTAVEPDNELDK